MNLESRIERLEDKTGTRNDKRMMTHRTDDEWAEIATGRKGAKYNELNEEEQATACLHKLCSPLSEGGEGLSFLDVAKQAQMDKEKCP